MNTDARDRLIVALDVESPDEARKVVSALRDATRTFKIGSQLFTSSGPGFVHEMVASGYRIFLDLKFHDIPNTVAAAGVAAARMGVWMFNVHVSGGREMMLRTVERVAMVSSAEGLCRPLVTGVTVLTSADSTTLSATGVAFGVEEQVVRLSLLAKESELDGIVASPNEANLIRSSVKDRAFIIITPGIRQAGTNSNDQKRVNTPGNAIRAGADFLVVGRAILKADDPAEAAFSVTEEIRLALEGK